VAGVARLSRLRLRTPDDRDGARDLREAHGAGDAPVGAGDAIWVSHPATNRVFRVRNPLTTPLVDVILGQTNAAGTLCNRGEIPPPITGTALRAEADMLCAPGAVALGASLVATRGYAHADTEAAWERARALSDAAGNAATLASALLPLSNLYVNRGEPDRSIMLAERVLAVSEDIQDRLLILPAHINAALAIHYQGRFTTSLVHCERVIALSDPPSDPAGASQRRRGQYGTPRVSALGFAAWNLWYLGHAGRALRRAREGVPLARAGVSIRSGVRPLP
jgi:hypothetical protein